MSASSLRLGIALLGAATGIIHLVVLNLRLMSAGFGFDIPFTLNGLGFLALSAVTVWRPGFLAGREALIRWGFIGFTVVTIVAWFILGDMADVLGWVTKLIEVALLVLLFLEGRRTTA
ncbi:MAG TPA: hypothetical protein PK954_26065 [Anaerolineales bacterium]|nr:hypothetical protein [Anaerolineales bacterium]HRF49856.1 hypothetical protein [Anaerolineales bacterium]